MTDRRLKITKAQADECRKLNQAAIVALREMDLYATAILNGHNITNPHAVVGVDKDDGGYVLVVRPNLP